jgi:hypothetical protein
LMRLKPCDDASRNHSGMTTPNGITRGVCSNVRN